MLSTKMAVLPYIVQLPKTGRRSLSCYRKAGLIQMLRTIMRLQQCTRHQPRVTMIQILLYYRASTNIQGTERNTPLYLACDKERVEEAKLLVSQGASIYIENEAKTPLQVAKGGQENGGRLSFLALFLLHMFWGCPQCQETNVLTTHHL